MADVSELRQLITSFRVSELQVLLGFAGRNKSGRKQELLQRALQLVERGCSTPIQIKIRELYRRRFPPKPNSPQHPVRPPSLATRSHTQGPATVEKKEDRQKLRGYPGYTSTNASPTDYSRSAMSPASSSSSSSSPHNNQVPIHPDVSFRKLPFYDTLAELLKPSSLVPRTQSRFQETLFLFHLTPQQAQDIAMSRDLKPNGGVDYTVQVQIRFCLLETSCDQEDNFPPSICVRVNSKMASLPNPIPTNKPGVEPKRPSRPVNITAICRISPTVANQVNISWASEFGRSYCVCIHLVRKLNSSCLLTRLKQGGVRHPDHTRALIKEKLRHDPDSEIATTSLRVSLLCPLGKMRMSIPCRAHTCNHLQCFDAPMFLQMNEKKPTWVCPVCDKSTEFSKLFIDGLFTEILTRASDSSEIRFTEDGDWHKMKAEETEKIEEIPIVQTIGDSPRKEDDSPSVSTEEKSSADFIDLTESDDELIEEYLDDKAELATTIMSSSCSSSSSFESSSGSSSPAPCSPPAVSQHTVISTAPAASPRNSANKDRIDDDIVLIDAVCAEVIREFSTPDVTSLQISAPSSSSSSATALSTTDSLSTSASTTDCLFTSTSITDSLSVSTSTSSQPPKMSLPPPPTRLVMDVPALPTLTAERDLFSLLDDGSRSPFEIDVPEIIPLD